MTGQFARAARNRITEMLLELESLAASTGEPEYRRAKDALDAALYPPLPTLADLMPEARRAVAGVS